MNRTLQSLLRYVVDSLNALSTHGLRLQSRANASGLQPLKSLSVLILRFFWGPPTYMFGPGQACSKETMHFHTMTLRGDWKFLKQCLCLCRNPQTEYICFSCMASKGNRDADMNFTDLSDDAPWRQTVFNCAPPWRHPPAFSSLKYFSVCKIGLDLLHIWHLGVCRDLTLA